MGGDDMTFAPAPQTVEDLLGTLTSEDVKAYLLAFIAVPQNPVTDWESGAVLRTMWELESLLTKDVFDFLVSQARQSYPNTAVGESLRRIARGFYQVDKTDATVATQNVTLRCDAGKGPYTAGQLAGVVGLTGDGLMYRVTSGGGIASGGTTTLVMTAETPGLARSLVTTLLSGLAGVSVQGSAIATPGSDADGDDVLRTGIAARLPAIDAIPAQDRVIAWALAADNTITRFRRDPDPAYPGGVLLTLANPSGGVSGGVVTAVQAKLDLYSPITDSNTSQTASTVIVTASGNVYVKAALLPGAQARANADWLAVMAGSPIGGRFYLETLRKVVGNAIKADPRANFLSPALAGADPDGNITLGSTEVPISPPGDGDTPLTSELIWVAT